MLSQLVQLSYNYAVSDRESCTHVHVVEYNHVLTNDKRMVYVFGYIGLVYEKQWNNDFWVHGRITRWNS